MDSALASSLVTGLALGVAGSLHCVGMCGPIVLALPGKTSSASGRGRISRSAFLEKLEYHVGRVTVYSLLGGIAGSASSVAMLAGVGRVVTIASGALMILLAASELLLRRGVIPARWSEVWGRILHRAFKRALSQQNGDARRHLLLGALNGLLPCGLVTSALLGAVSTSTMSGGVLFMALFGLGTMPLMLAVSVGGMSVSCRIRAKLRIALPSVALLFGVLILLRGMALGVPFLSPKAPTLVHTVSSNAAATGSAIDVPDCH